MLAASRYIGIALCGECCIVARRLRCKSEPDFICFSPTWVLVVPCEVRYLSPIVRTLLSVEVEP